MSSNDDFDQQYYVQLGARKATNGQIRWGKEGLCHIVAIGLICQVKM